MKKIYLMLAVGAITLASCANNSGSDANSDKAKTDSSAAVTNPPDNNAATNPSLGDTAYRNNDTTRMKKDSTRSNPR